MHPVTQSSFAPIQHAAVGNDAGTIELTAGHFRDLRRLRQIQVASFRPRLAYSWWVLGMLLALPFVTFRVARDMDTRQAVGLVIADRDKGNIRIINIAVAPEYRRRGIGSRLLRYVDHHLTNGNIVLMVEEANRGAQALYEAEGFVRSGFRPNYYGTNRHGIEMTLHRPVGRRT